MAVNNQENQGTLVSVKRVRKDVDAKNRDKVVLTFGTDNQGRDGLAELIAALKQYEGKQVNFDIRLDKKTTERGVAFDTAFVIVKEMIPKAAGGGAPGKAQYVPKQSRKDQVQQRAKQINESFGE